MQIPELVLTGPDSIVASIPYIIGFTPHESLVVMWMRHGSVRLTMRLDLPPRDVAPLGWVDAVLSHCGTSDEAIVCVLISAGEPMRDDRGELRCADLVSDLLRRLAGTDCLVRDALLVDGDRWWSYLCEEPECCPAGGTPLDPQIAEGVAARFVLAGVGRLPDRQAVVAMCAADPALQSRTREGIRLARRSRAEALSESADPALALERWRDASIADACRALLGERPPSPGDEAAILMSLSDVRVRDTVLWEVAHAERHDPHGAFERAAALLRVAPPGVIAPIGAVTAVLAWLTGDGVRACAALDRVDAEDPHYALAELLRRSIAAGLPASSWLEMMQSLPRRACRGARPLPVGPSGA